MSILKRFWEGTKKVVGTIIGGVQSVLSPQPNPSYIPGVPHGFVEPPAWVQEPTKAGVPIGGVTVGDVAKGVLAGIAPKTVDKVTGFIDKTKAYLGKQIEVDTPAGRSGIYAIPNYVWYIVAGLFLFVAIRKK